MPRGFDGHRDHLMRGSELPAAAFQGGGALEMLCYLSLQGLPRHSRVYCNLHLDGGWHDSLELRCVHTAIAEKEPGLLKGHAGPSQSLVEADRDEHDEMNLEHAIDANQLQLEEDDAPAKERAKIVSKAAVTEGEGLSLLQQAAQGSNVVAASAGNTDGDRRHARFEDRSDGSNGDTRGARASGLTQRGESHKTLDEMMAAMRKERKLARQSKKKAPKATWAEREAEVLAMENKRYANGEEQGDGNSTSRGPRGVQ